MAGEKLVNLIRQGARNAIPNSSLTDMLFGEVTSINPLKVKIDNRFEVSENFLVLSRFCFKKEIEFMLNYCLEEKGTPITIMLWDDIKVGENLTLLRCSSGQKYFVLDRSGL